MFSAGGSIGHQGTPGCRFISRQVDHKIIDSSYNDYHAKNKGLTGVCMMQLRSARAALIQQPRGGEGGWLDGARKVRAESRHEGICRLFEG